MTGVLTTKSADYEPVISPYAAYRGSIGDMKKPYNYVYTKGLYCGSYKKGGAPYSAMGYISLLTGNDGGNGLVNLYPTENATTSANFIFPTEGGTVATIEALNLKSITRVTATVTTGGTGNIATSYANDGYTYIIAPIVSGNSCYLRAWISANNNGWYLTAIDPNTGATINNTSINIRYLVVKIKYT